MDNTYQYDAFGAPIASTGAIVNTYLYSGERFDSNLNLYHLRARFYNMLTGRFETMDPVPGKINDPRTLHKYVYSANNPVNASDPTGKDIAENATIESSEHAYTHLLGNGLELSQPEVNAYVEQLVRYFIANNNVTYRSVFDIPFVIDLLNNVPWAARVFIVSDALIAVSYFPINFPQP